MSVSPSGKVKDFNGTGSLVASSLALSKVEKLDLEIS